jgi:isoamyl acetate esterase
LAGEVNSVSSIPLRGRAVPRILLLGDSIKVYMQPFVTEMLAGKAVVEGPESCKTSGNLLEHLDSWLEGKNDIIHFNCGLHDIAIDRASGRRRTELTQYQQNIHQICQRLRQTEAKLIWATSTPVIDERHMAAKSFDRSDEDVQFYNRAALEVISQYDIIVNDLYRVVADAGKEKYISEDGVHHTSEGCRLLAQAVVNVVQIIMER